MLRAAWAGIPIRSRPITVVYPTNRTTHFRLVIDNVRIVALNTLAVLRHPLPLPLGRSLFRIPAPARVVALRAPAMGLAGRIRPTLARPRGGRRNSRSHIPRRDMAEGAVLGRLRSWPESALLPAILATLRLPVAGGAGTLAAHWAGGLVLGALPRLWRREAAPLRRG